MSVSGKAKTEKENPQIYYYSYNTNKVTVT